MVEKVGASNAIHEVVVGERVGRSIAAEVHTLAVDVLHGERTGRSIAADVLTQSADVLHGERIGRDIATDVLAVVSEALIRIRPITAVSQRVELLVSLPNDPIKPGGQVYRFAQEVFQQRDPLPLPSTVWSWTHVFTYGQVVTTHRVVPGIWPRSPNTAASVVQQALLKRTGRPPISPLQAKTLRSLAVVSRGDVYVRTSGVFLAQGMWLATAGRDPMPAPSTLRSPIQSRTAVELVVLSKAAREPDPTNVQVATSHQFAIAWRSRAWTVDQQVGVLVQMTTVTRVPVLEKSPEQVAWQNMLALQARVPEPPHGPNEVAQQVQAAIQARAPGYPMSATTVSVLAAMAALRRVLPRPGDVGGWYAGEFVQTAVAIRNVLLPGQITNVQVAQGRITYTMGRTVKSPISVIDPTVGRHVFSLHQKIVSFRPTLTPEDKMRQQRNVFSLALWVTLPDASFPPPPTEPEIAEGAVLLVAQQVLLPDDTWQWEPTSRLTALAVQQHVAVADPADWIDPTTPGSDAAVLLAAEAVAAADPDGWIDPQTAASDAYLLQVSEQVAAVDASFPPTTVPLSEVDLLLAAEALAMGDDSFPDGTQPQSAVDLVAVVNPLVSQDHGMIGRLPVSQQQVLAVMAMVVVPDPTLGRIPARPRGPRPSVSIMRH